MEGDVYFDPIGDPDEGNTTIHTEVLAIESHDPGDGSLASSSAYERQLQDCLLYTSRCV